MPANTFTTAMEAASQNRNTSDLSTVRPQQEWMEVLAAAVTRPGRTQGLRSIGNDLEALSSQLQSGEPRPPSLSLRRRIGFLMKRRLYGLIWWQSHQINSLVGLVARLSREQKTLVDAVFHTTDTLSQNVQQLSRQNRDAHISVVNSDRRIGEAEARLQELESEQSSLRLAELGQSIAGLQSTLNELQSALTTAQGVHSDLTRRLDIESAEKQHLTARVQELEDSLQRINSETPSTRELAARVSELGLFTHQTRATLSIQDRRLGVFIEEARKHLPNALAPQQVEDMARDHSEHRYDSLYRAFEHVFRGTRVEIKARHLDYLELLKRHAMGSFDSPVLDLGCGRGEWLELLHENGLHGRGVDLNESMIEACKSLGLHVTQDDAIHCLASLPDASLGAVTAFHMVEHTPFDLVLTIVDESLRVLKPGGILIFETPNPQNFQVASHTFYLDPTHLKPLPSAMLRFFVEGRGFCDVRVLDLHPYPQPLRLPDDGTLLTIRFNEFFYGPQDYAVIGRRP